MRERERERTCIFMLPNFSNFQHDTFLKLYSSAMSVNRALNLSNSLYLFLCFFWQNNPKDFIFSCYYKCFFSYYEIFLFQCIERKLTLLHDFINGNLLNSLILCFIQKLVCLSSSVYMQKIPSANDMILLLSSSCTLFFSCSGLIVLARTCKTVLNRNDVIPELFLILRRPLSKFHSLVLCTISCFVESLYSIKEVFIYSYFC